MSNRIRRTPRAFSEVAAGVIVFIVLVAIMGVGFSTLPDAADRVGTAAAASADVYNTRRDSTVIGATQNTLAYVGVGATVTTDLPGRYTAGDGNRKVAVAWQVDQNGGNIGATFNNVCTHTRITAGTPVSKGHAEASYFPNAEVADDGTCTVAAPATPVDDLAEQWATIFNAIGGRNLTETVKQTTTTAPYLVAPGDITENVPGAQTTTRGSSTWLFSRTDVSRIAFQPAGSTVCQQVSISQFGSQSVGIAGVNTFPGTTPTSSGRCG